MTYGVSLRVFGFYHTGVMGQFIDKAFTIPLISQCDVCPNSLWMVTITQTDRHLTF